MRSLAPGQRTSFEISNLSHIDPIAEGIVLSAAHKMSRYKKGAPKDEVDMLMTFALGSGAYIQPLGSKHSDFEHDTIRPYHAVIDPAVLEHIARQEDAVITSRGEAVATDTTDALWRAIDTEIDIAPDSPNSLICYSDEGLERPYFFVHLSTGHGVVVRELAADDMLPEGTSGVPADVDELPRYYVTAIFEPGYFDDAFIDQR